MAQLSLPVHAPPASYPRHNFQTIGWFWDLFTRKLLDLDPPFQRRSVWNEEYRQYFIDTVLMGYPAPAIFLFEEVSTDGVSRYAVVDGKQRLTAIFDFCRDRFSVGEQADRLELRGSYFSHFPDEAKKRFWIYQMLVEYVPSTEEAVLTNIFDRINRNVAKLSPQELRHARFDGSFIRACENLAAQLEDRFPGFPNIARQSRRQMKDIELVAQLLLCLEEGIKGYSQGDLDEAFSTRDSDWEKEDEVSRGFRDALGKLHTLTEGPMGEQLLRSRLRNQADFFSLFLALSKIDAIDQRAQQRLAAFIADVERVPHAHEEAKRYYEDVRSASNDAGPRQRRIELMQKVLRGEVQWVEGE